VFIFERDRGGLNNWGGTLRRRSTTEAEQDEFGASVSIGADAAIVGGRFHSPVTPLRAGAAYVLERKEGTSPWSGPFRDCSRCSRTTAIPTARR
jgi:hypothetical protein